MRPHPAAHLAVPAHGMTQPAVRVKKRAIERLGPRLQNHLYELEPYQRTPRGHVTCRQDLMLVSHLLRSD